jgi:hypothetical protein
MSVKFKNSIFSRIVLMITFLSMQLPSYANETRQQNRGTCDGNECSLTLSHHSSGINKLCETSVLTVFWTKQNPYYLIECDCNCSMQRNNNWIVDVKNKKVYGLSYGRYVKQSYIESATTDTEVPDKFSSVKLCQAPRIGSVNGSIFVLLNKVPNESIYPYCYEITYIKKNGNIFEIQNDVRSIPNGDRNYWMLGISKNQKDALLSIAKSIKR